MEIIKNIFAVIGFACVMIAVLIMIFGDNPEED